MENLFPKISCLCVTSNRPNQLKVAIACFRAQNYPNKELIILFDISDSATQAVFDSIEDDDIKSFRYNKLEDSLTLGDVRNISIRVANGDYFCMWDDDDWHHPDRLIWQMEHIFFSGKEASILFYILIFDQVKKKTYLSAPRPWEGTVLCHKDFALKNLISYKPLSRGEDTSFIGRLVELDAVCPVIRPQLYVYNYTGYNTWDESHFKRMFSHARLLPRANSIILNKILNSADIPSYLKLIDGTDFSRNFSYRLFLNFFLHNVLIENP